MLKIHLAPKCKIFMTVTHLCGYKNCVYINLKFQISGKSGFTHVRNSEFLKMAENRKFSFSNPEMKNFSDQSIQKGYASVVLSDRNI